jgi:hypothetical protein
VLIYKGEILPNRQPQVRQRQVFKLERLYVDAEESHRKQQRVA